MAELNDKENTQKRFEALFQYASIGIIVTGHEGNIVDINKYAEGQFGYSREELIGKQIEVLVPQQFRPHHHEHRNKYYQHPHPRSMGAGRDLFALKKDGSTFPVEISLSHYELNNELFVMAFIIDITIRKQNELSLLEQKGQLESQAGEVMRLNSELERKVEDRTKMLKETLRELEISKEELSESLEKEKELGELKSRFVTMASHEFRTPLSTILSSASLVSKYNNVEDEEKRVRHVNRIKESVESMKSILEDFLSLGKLEEGSLKAKPENRQFVEAIEAIHDLVQDFKHLSKKGQEIIFTHQGDGDFDIDLSLLRNVLTNLISNAIKFSGPNGIIKIDFELEDDLFIVKVADNGMGISEEDLEHLFERFFRARNAVNIQGTGLGLHIVARYIELMGGQINVNSKLEAGTTFIVTIPRYIL